MCRIRHKLFAHQPRRLPDGPHKVTASRLRHEKSRAPFCFVAIPSPLIYIRAMKIRAQNFDRRTLLYAFGLASVTATLPSGAAASGKVTVAKAGENRFPFANLAQAKATPCKVTSENSGGACTIFEMNALPRSGPFQHVHHREDEWYYVLSGEFIFKAGGEEFNLSTGGSIWLPRGIPHVWANPTTSEAKLILMCQPGGFEKFFDEAASVPLEQKNPDTMKTLMAKYGMEMIGPPIFASSWMQQH
jgi:quercetin dioxygenase-like cupin family protein